MVGGGEQSNQDKNHQTFDNFLWHYHIKMRIKTPGEEDDGGKFVIAKKKKARDL